jgi:PAS domain S-box-containing protein
MGLFVLSYLEDVSMDTKPTYEELEQRVEERTAELATANETLKKQIEERKRMEETLHAYKQIVSTITDLMSFLDTNYRYQVVNDAYLKAFPDKPREEIVGHTPADLIGEENFRDKIKPNLDQCLKGEIVNYQDQFEFPGAGKRYMDVSYYPVFAEDGAVSGIVYVSRDITEWKKIEINLHDSQHMLQTVLDSIPAAVFWKDRDLLYLGGNRTWLAEVGLNSSEEVVGKSDYELPWDKEQADSFREDDRKVIESGIPEYDIIEPYLKADGTHAWAKTNKVPLRDAEGNILGVLGTYEEITERKRAEEALRAERDKLEIVTRNIGAGLCIISKDYRTIWANKVLKDIFGDVEGKVCHLTYNKQPEVCPGCGVKEVFETGKDRVVHEQVGEDADNNTIWSQIIATPIRDEEGNITSALEVVVPITERKRAEEALRESKAQIQLIVDNLPYVIFQIDKDLKVLWANKVGNEMNPDAVGQPCYKAFALREKPCEDCNGIAAISTGQIVTGTMYHPKVEGIQSESYWEQTAVPLRNDQGEVIGAIELSNNITERKRLEAQLQQAQKMKAIATLAGGIAHEFNNALVGISGNIELLQMDLPNGENIDKYVERTKESTRRMVGLTNQLLAYARGGKYQPKIMSLNDLVQDTIPLIRHDIDSAIRVETDLPGDISYVEADPTQIQMVLSAVLNNAAEAIEREGRIRIITRDEKIDKEFVETLPYFKLGHYVCLTIEDEGKGMDEETRSRLFEPFFTTKFQGRGLGMAAVYGVLAWLRCMGL